MKTYQKYVVSAVAATALLASATALACPGGYCGYRTTCPTCHTCSTCNTCGTVYYHHTCSTCGYNGGYYGGGFGLGLFAW